MGSWPCEQVVQVSDDDSLVARSKALHTEFLPGAVLSLYSASGVKDSGHDARF